MFDISGLISQYGFEFQKKVFIHYLIHKMDVGAKLSYELLDDIDFNQEELSITKFDKHLIQCKTGEFKYDVFKHVICNWVLSDKVDKYLLYLDKPMSFTYNLKSLCDDIQADVIKYMKKEKKRCDCFKYRINLQFKGFSNQNEIQNFKDSVYFG